MTRLQYVPLLADDLHDLGACADQVQLFEDTFGAKGATPDDVPKAVAAGLDVHWLVLVIAPAPAWRAYEEAKAPAWRAYQEAKAPAWRAYQEATAALAADCLAVYWPVWEGDR